MNFSKDLSRRDIIKLAGVAALTSPFTSCTSSQNSKIKLSLAEYSFHRSLYAANPKANRYNIPSAGNTALEHLDFAKATRQLGIDGAEYVNFFFPEMNFTPAYLKEMNKRADDNGIDNVLIMVGREGNLGNPDSKARKQALENHKKWIVAAAELGCHCIRVDAKGTGDAQEQIKNIGDSLHQLASYADQYKLDITVENHGGLSSNGDWLVKCIKAADHKRVGTLPDYGNFYDSEQKKFFDPYEGTQKMLPYAKAVSAKTYDLVPGTEATMRHPEKGYELDFKRLVKMTLESGYNGYIGIEYEGGDKIKEKAGILMTKRLLEKYIAEFS
ncbi:MAG: sugar phosphate isomerase/epimerase [Lentisphaeraceae bacterium]|nr:sugar phosphate isomerase/epimerase [Lentisphaeraceae bacterium]